MTIANAPHPESRWVVAGTAIGLVLVTVLACWRAVLVGFVSDDFLLLGRLASAGGLHNPAAYFGLRLFEYYRPLAFLDLAIDWQLWGAVAAGYHATALALHVLNTLLVFVLARRVMRHTGAWATAVLFALHPSNHEAVYWMSARFDLLAASFVLLGLIVLRWRTAFGDALMALAFFAAILSKESALALPAIAMAYAVLVQGDGPARLIRQLVGTTVAGVFYTLLRQGAGLASMGGAARLPKLMVLAALVGALMVVARVSWARVSGGVTKRRRLVGLIAAAGLGLVGALALGGPVAHAVRGTLGSITFAATHLLSPVSVDAAVGTLPPSMWIAGWFVLALAVAAGLVALPLLARSPETAFIVVFLLAALVPVSSMTEGTRYLYLAAIPAAMLAGKLVDAFDQRQPLAVTAGLVLLAGLNTWQMQAKASDWIWASGMASRAAITMRTAMGDRCDGRDIVLLTAPVRVRGVYANLNLEGLARLADCRPAGMRTLVRVGLQDPQISGQWTSRSTVEMVAHGYAGDFITSRDLRTFDVPLDGAAPVRVVNPMGSLEASPGNGDLTIRMTFDGDRTRPGTVWCVFSDGALRVLMPPVSAREVARGTPPPYDRIERAR